MKPNLNLVEGGTNLWLTLESQTLPQKPDTGGFKIFILDIDINSSRALQRILVGQQTYANGASAAEAGIDGVWLHQRYEYNPE